MNKLQEFLDIFALEKVKNYDYDDGEVLKGVGAYPETFDYFKLDACFISALVIGLHMNDIDIYPEN